MGIDFEKRCETYKRELEEYLKDNLITIAEYCKELNDSFLLDILFPKTEDELRDAITSFNMYRTIRNEVVYNNRDLESNTAYLINVMAIEGLDEEHSGLYQEIEDAMYLVTTDETARTRFQLDSLKMQYSEIASNSIASLIASKSTGLSHAERLFDAYTNNLLLTEAKSIKRAIRDNPSGMTGRILLTSYQESMTGIRGYITNKKRMYDYIISTSEPQMMRKIEKK